MTKKNSWGTWCKATLAANKQQKTERQKENGSVRGEGFELSTSGVLLHLPITTWWSRWPPGGESWDQVEVSQGLLLQMVSQTLQPRSCGTWLASLLHMDLLSGKGPVVRNWCHLKAMIIGCSIWGIFFWCFHPICPSSQLSCSSTCSVRRPSMSSGFRGETRPHILNCLAQLLPNIPIKDISTSSLASSSFSPWSASCTAATASRASGSSPSSPARWPWCSPTGAGTSTSSTRAWSTQSPSRLPAKLVECSPCSTSLSSSQFSCSTGPWSLRTPSTSPTLAARGTAAISSGNHLRSTTKVWKEQDVSN